MNLTGIGLDTVVAQTPGVVALDLDGETVMMNVASGKYYALNRIASNIWVLLSEPRTVSDIVDRLLTEYTISAETCQTQVMEFIVQMEQAGIVTLG